MATPEPGPVRSAGGALAVEVTARCNRSCRYCYNTWRLAKVPPEPELPASELTGIVESALQQSGRQAVQLTGGEPLLRPDLFDIIAELSTPGRSISLVTDGGLIDEAAAAELKRLGVGPVQPTLLAGMREVHDHLKGAASFDATIDAIARLQRHKVPVSVSFVCTRVNWEHFRETVELCFALGVRTVAFSRFCTAGAGAERAEELTPTPDMVAECLDVAIEANSRLDMRVRMAISLPLCLPRAEQHRQLRFGSCALSSDEPGYTIDPWGRLRACSVSPVVLGDLRRESWAAVLGRAAHSYFPGVTTLPAACRECSLGDRCRGGCRESARAAYGHLRYPDPLARTRTILE